MTTANIFEDKPRWPGAPPVCEARNLFAFDTRKQAAKFLDENSPGKTLPTFECDACGCFHHIHSRPNPIPGKYGNGQWPTR